ncbi:MAG: TraR/DksA C4-type zinc finger protein [Chlamydiae bacterium]|nr:TraR/DksA C4-type zinc finger protein [Chlamydiota bacterium]
MPLKKTQIVEFKKRLEQIQRQMTTFVKEAKKGVLTDDKSKGYSQHQADEGTDDFDRIINLKLTDEELKILKQIERALEKITEGTYGICDITGEEIPLKRLEAVPYATMTVQAQEKFEKGLL